MKELEAYVYYQSVPGTDMHKLYYLNDADGSVFMMWNLMVFRGMQRGDLDLYKAGLIHEAELANAALEDVPVIAQSAYERSMRGKNGERELLGLYLTYCHGYPLINELLAYGDKLIGGYNGPLTENMTLYQTTINDELNAAMVKVIMGEDISVYEKAVESWYANGGQAITDDVNAYYGK